MQDEYLQSKDNNVFLRYNNMKHMIHEVCNYNDFFISHKINFR